MLRPFSRHVLQRTVVLPELRLLFLPVPKAGCTSVLWLLAELAGFSEEHFGRSTLPEASPALTVHDMSLWSDEHRLVDRGGQPRERALTEDGWLRFTLVREPAARLWSAWQSKLLLREPRFAEAFGDEPWFPRVPERPADLIEDFRRFVAALAGGGVEDVHWSIQHDLVAQLPLTHVGRVERMHETLALLRAHLPARLWPQRSGRENRSPLPMPPHAYDDDAVTVLHERYRADFVHFGYQLPATDPSGAAEWERRVAPLLPVLRGTIGEHVRVGQLHRVAQQRARRVRAAEEKLEAVAARQIGPARSPLLTNIEGEADFHVRWGWSAGSVEPGFTAVLRVKDEARSLPWVLPPLLRAVRRVVVIDNGSTDGTAGVARRVALKLGAAERLEIDSYPFAVARCGEEHLRTPAASVHSLAYFYNWSFAHVRTCYALKWDGDMVLSDAAVAVLRDLAWQLEASQAVIRIPRYPLYLADDRRAFLDIGMRNCEPWGWPNRPGYSFVKAIEWELPLWGADIRAIELPDPASLELKYLDADEFAHWSPTDFASSARTQRKRREWAVFHALAGGGAPPDGVLPVIAPEGVHVIDHVRASWNGAAAPTALPALAA